MNCIAALALIVTIHVVADAPVRSAPATPLTRTGARADVVRAYGDVVRLAYDKAASLDVAGAAAVYDAFFRDAFGSADGVLDALARTRTDPTTREKAERAVLLRAASDMLLLDDLTHAAVARVDDVASARVLAKGLLALFQGDPVHARGCAHALWSRMAALVIADVAGGIAPASFIVTGDAAARVKSALEAEAKSERVPIAWPSATSATSSAVGIRNVTTSSHGSELRIHWEITGTKSHGDFGDADAFARDVVADRERELLDAFSR